MNNTEITIFENADFGTIRTATDKNNGKVLFCGADVAKALGYANTKDAIATHVDDEDKQLLQRSDFATLENHIPKEALSVNFVRADIPNRGLTFINESGVYSLVFSSKLPKAKEFKHWVTSEILPAIRKHGAYMTEQTLQKALTSPDFLIQLATQLKTEQEQRKQLELVTKVQKQQIAELQPKADYCDSILSCQGVMPINIIAKDYGKSAIWLNQHLHAKGVQYSMDGVWVLYQKYANKGYTVTKTVPYTNPYTGLKEFNVHTYWTQKGRLFIYDLLKADGILPLIERSDSDES